MNLEQIINEVNKDIDDSIGDEEIKGWVNRGIDDLSPLVKKEAYVMTNVTQENRYDLPADLMEIAFIRADGREYPYIPINDNDSTGYKVWGGKLYFQPEIDNGEVELFYHKRLNHLDALTDEPEFEPAFHDLLVLYAISQSQFADEEPQRQIDAMNRYLGRKEEFKSYLFSQSNAAYQIKEVGW